MRSATSRDVEPAPLLADPGKKQDLEQEVPELAGQGFRILRVDRVEDLVTLLEEVGPKSFRGLLPVPRAFAAKFLDERDQPRKLLRHAGIIAS